MKRSSSRTDEELTAIYSRHIGAVYRLCRLHTKNTADAEDVTQAAFVRLMEASPAFESQAHERAWLLRTAINLCKNHLRHWWRKTVDLDQAGEISAAQPENEILTLIRDLPQPYRSVIYLHYYEGYNTAEIARIMGGKPSTVRSRLVAARKLLRIEMEDDEP